MPRRGLTPADVEAAAAAIADADGLEAVTIARVAAELGVRPPSLYNHVKGRDDLVRAISLRALGDLADEMGAATQGRAGADALVAAAVAYRRFALAHPGRAATVVRAADPADEVGIAAAGAVERIFGAALRGWALADEDLVHAVRAVRAAVVGFVAIETAGGFRLTVDRETSFRRLVDALARGLTPGT